MLYEKDEIDKLLVENNRLHEIVNRLKNAKLSQERWEDDEDIVTLNGKPVGATISHKNRLEFDRWWESVKEELLKRETEHESENML